MQCPICQQWVIQRTINDHIDKGCPEPSHAAPPSPKVEEPPRVASLFLPKVTKKPSPPRELKQRPFFSQESKPPPRNPFVSQQEHPFSQETKPSVKRQAEPPVTPPVKRSKNDIILESMPLAAKGNTYKRNVSVILKSV